jgi:hypothetical protein
MAERLEFPTWAKQPSLLALAALLLILCSSGRAAASCWASNRDGGRRCERFVNPYGGIEKLCEDQLGDCAALGYTEAPELQSPESGSPTTTPKESTSLPLKVQRYRHFGKTLLTKPSVERAKDAERLKHSEYIGSEAASSLDEARMVVGLLLITSLFTAGMVLLPPRHRAIVGNVAKTLVLFMVAVLGIFATIAATGASDRRGRYRGR